MGAIADLLDQVRIAGNFNSDMGLAEKLGVKRQTLHAWRHDQAPIPDERIAQLCALAKLDGPEWMARIHADRAQSPAERALWSKMLTRLAAAALFIVPLTACAKMEKLDLSSGYAPGSAGYVYYVQIVRTWLATSMARLLHPRWLSTRSLQHA